ncbi:TonB-dependent receptor [Maribellus luteus]|uniref:TonB-dependent receptor n=2 Tax=Maribellus luteus TaxID=2305463 RepID=A0A399SZ20_9BACT|nr:TonB-dependent receptor [Maribellus luteus]
MNRIVISILLLIQAISAMAQTGSVKGTVIDAKTKETLIGTTVMLKETSQGTITDFDGNFLVQKVQAGKYTLLISFISYDSQELNIEVKPNEEVTLNVALSPATLELEGVQVVAKANRESESMLLAEQKNAVVATQAIGAQEISRKGASDAEAAVTKVSGIAKQEGVKNVFVRGLGDRFNATTLNGFPVPSEDPEYKNISLDFFSSDMIKAVGVNKVFSAQMTGDVAGAEINISSKELLGDSEFGIDLSAGVNTQTLGKEFMLSDGVNALGFAQSKTAPTNEAVYSFGNSLNPTSQNLQLNRALSFAGGKRYKTGTGKDMLSFYVIGSYDADYSYVNGIVRNTTTSGTVFRDQMSDEFELKTTHLLMGNLEYGFNDYELSYNAMVIHSNTRSMLDYNGMHSNFEDVDDYKGLIRRQQINDNTLIVNQLRLNRQFNSRLSANTGASFNYTMGSEPDRRINYLSDLGNRKYHLLKGTGRQQRFFSDLNVADINVQLEMSYKLTDDEENVSLVKAGYKGRFAVDDFQGIEWDNQRVTQPEIDQNNIDLDGLFNQSALDNGDFINSEFESSYSVDKYINSGYAELMYQLNPSLILNAGLRADLVYLDVAYDVNRGSSVGNTTKDYFYLLPSLNLKYSLNKDNVLRLGASRTYTLPQSKEISPYRYVGRNWSSQGNPDLIPSTNYNLDLKWDYFLSRDELFSVAVFGKYIQDPISRIEKASAGGFLTYENIADNAIIGGVEVEVRKNLFSTQKDNAGTYSKLSMGVNASYLKTDVEVKGGLNFTNKKTELEGAAPFLVNADLSYQFHKTDLDFTASLVKNYFSERIYTVGAGGYQDIVENGVPTLDFVSSLKYKKHWGLSLKARNLLDPSFKLTRKPNAAGADPIVLSDYKKGMSFNLGVSYNF